MCQMVYSKYIGKDADMSKTNKRRCKAGEVYACYIAKLEKYCAYQILRVEGKSVLYLALDYLDEVIPTPAMLESIQPYRMNRYMYRNARDKSWVDSTSPPEEYIYVGSCEFKGKPNSNDYSGKWPLGKDYVYEEMWKNYDESVTSAYKKNLSNREMVVVGDKEFPRNIGTLDNDLLNIIDEVEVYDSFPCIVGADIIGYEPFLTKILEYKQLIRSLTLERPDAEIVDLKNTHINQLNIDVTGVKKIMLPYKVEFLNFYGEVDKNLIIESHYCETKIILSVDMRHLDFSRLKLDKNIVTYLTIKGAKEVDLSYVAENFPELTGMYIEGNPGILNNIHALKQIEKINSVYITDMFGYSAEDLKVLEELPKLKNIDFESIPKDAGMYLKECWKDRLQEFRVTCLRDDNWMKENFENPLRHWDGSEFVPKRAYNSAIKCFKETKKKLQMAESREEVIEAITQYTLKFNQLNSKYDEFIETEEREDIFVAIKKLYETCILHEDYNLEAEKHAIVTLQEIWDVIDKNRDLW